jgi:hypothetical protein
MSAPTVRISEASHQLLKQLAEQTGQTMTDVLDNGTDLSAFSRPNAKDFSEDAREFLQPKLLTKQRVFPNT